MESPESTTFPLNADFVTGRVLVLRQIAEVTHRGTDSHGRVVGYASMCLSTVLSFGSRGLHKRRLTEYTLRISNHELILDRDNSIKMSRSIDTMASSLCMQLRLSA